MLIACKFVPFIFLFDYFDVVCIFIAFKILQRKTQNYNYNLHKLYKPYIFNKNVPYRELSLVLTSLLPCWTSQLVPHNLKSRPRNFGGPKWQDCQWYV